MEISVCITRVADTASRVDLVDGDVDTSRIAYVLNPYDEYAIEEAVRTRTRFAGSRVTVFTAGQEDSKEILRKALAMGADRAVLVRSGEPADSWMAACALSEAIRRHYGDRLPEIVFCGKESTDFQCRLVPGLIAGMLGMAMVSAVSMLELMDGSLSAESEIEGGRERLRAFLPAVVTTEKGLNIPSKTGIKAVLAAKRAVIDEMEVSQREPAMVRFAAYESPERKKQCRFYQDTKELAALLNAERAPGV